MGLMNREKILNILSFALIGLLLVIPGTCASVTGAPRFAATGDVNAGTWELVTADAGWSARHSHASVVTPDGTIILMGGFDGSGKNDVWRSTDEGATWTLVNAHAGWLPRQEHSSVVMPDGTIVILGGSTASGYVNDVWQSRDKGVTWIRVNASTGWTPRDSLAIAILPDNSIIVSGGTLAGGYSQFNDVWRSTDKGVTWIEMTPHAGWSPRYGHRMVVMPDGSVVLTGGYTYGTGRFMNDVWRSTDKGATWSLVTPNAGWPGRILHTSTVRPDGSIILTGGQIISGYANDTWQSADNGATWKQITPHAGWESRFTHTSVVMPDGSMVLMGGWDGREKGDVWRFVPAGSTPGDISGTILENKTISPDIGSITMTGSETVIPTDGLTVTPLCPAGTPFDAYRYPQDTHRSDPMVSTCVWDGTGRVFISGDSLSVTGICADDGYTVTIQPSGATFDAKIHSGVQHPIIELTSGMRPGTNTITVIVENWNGLSMSYGRFIQSSVRQVPYIVQVTDASPTVTTARADPAGGAPLRKNETGTIYVKKDIRPVSLKQGTGGKITVTVFNPGPGTVHDVEILDTTLPEFPVTEGVTQYTIPVIGSNETRILTYTVQATKPGSFRFNRTTVMFADGAGNYYRVYSGYENVSVMAPLIPDEQQNRPGDPLRGFITWINSLGRP